MEENKFQNLEKWLNNAQRDNCDNYFAMAVNGNHELCASISCSSVSMIEMLMTCCNKNESFRNALMATAAIISQGEIK